MCIYKEQREQPVSRKSAKRKQFFQSKATKNESTYDVTALLVTSFVFRLKKNNNNSGWMEKWCHCIAQSLYSKRYFCSFFVTKKRGSANSFHHWQKESKEIWRFLKFCSARQKRMIIEVVAGKFQINMVDAKFFFIFIYLFVYLIIYFYFFDVGAATNIKINLP